MKIPIWCFFPRCNLLVSVTMSQAIWLRTLLCFVSSVSWIQSLITPIVLEKITVEYFVPSEAFSMGYVSLGLCVSMCLHWSTVLSWKIWGVGQYVMWTFRLFHHVVDTDRTGTKILQEMNRLRLAGEVTFMPLNRLEASETYYPETTVSIFDEWIATAIMR